MCRGYTEREESLLLGATHFLFPKERKKLKGHCRRRSRNWGCMREGGDMWSIENECIVRESGISSDGGPFFASHSPKAC